MYVDRGVPGSERPRGLGSEVTAFAFRLLGILGVRRGNFRFGSCVTLTSYGYVDTQSHINMTLRNWMVNGGAHCYVRQSLSPPPSRSRRVRPPRRVGSRRRRIDGRLRACHCDDELWLRRPGIQHPPSGRRPLGLLGHAMAQ